MGDDLVLPEDVAERMVNEISDVQLVELQWVNHYSILFGAMEERKQTILQFLATT